LSKEGIRERINDLREILKGLITLIIGLVSGEVFLVYQILNKKIAVFNIFVVLVGILILFLFLIWGKFLWNIIDEYERKL